MSAVALALVVISGCCATPHEKSINEYISEAGTELDIIARSVENYGTVSASNPLLIRPPDYFGYDLDLTARDYFDADRTSVAFSYYNAEVERSRSALALNLDKLAKAVASVAVPGGAGLGAVDAALQAVQSDQSVIQTLTGMPPEAQLSPEANELVGQAETRNEMPESESADAPDSSPLPALSLPQLPAQPLSPRLAQFSGELTLSPMARLRMSATEKMTQDILQFFAKPDEKLIGDNKRYYFALMTVSAAPGLLTQSGYAAEVAVNLEYRDSEDGKYSFATSGRPLPTVTAVYPLVDSQVLDLRSSLRRQQATANRTDLSFLGQQAASERDAIRTREADAQSLSDPSVVVSTSHAGASFGFRIEPSYRALTDEGGNLTEDGALGASRVLNPITFPALVILVVDESDVIQSNGAPNPSGYDDRGFDQFVFHVNSRWTPLEFGSARMGESEFASRISAWRNAFKILVDVVQTYAASGNNPQEDSGLLSLRRRIMMYEPVGLGGTIFVDLPITKQSSPRSLEVTPWTGATHDAWVNRPSVITIAGQNLSPDQVQGVYVGGVEAPIAAVTKQAIVAVVPPYDTRRSTVLPGTHQVDVVTSAGITTIGQLTYSKVQILTPGAAAPRPPAADTVLIIDRDQNGYIVRVELDGPSHARSRELLEAIRSMLRDGREGEFDLKIDAHGGVGFEASNTNSRETDN